jgi:hypothetical protein
MYGSFLRNCQSVLFWLTRTTKTVLSLSKIKVKAQVNQRISPGNNHRLLEEHSRPRRILVLILCGDSYRFMELYSLIYVPLKKLLGCFKESHTTERFMKALEWTQSDLVSKTVAFLSRSCGWILRSFTFKRARARQAAYTLSAS